MDIYGEIASNRRKTILIILAFPLLLAALLYITLWIFYAFSYDPLAGETVSGQVVGLFLVILPVLSILSIGWMIISYFMGGNMMMSMADAKEIKRADAPEIYSLVENIAKVAGAPTPRVFIMNTSMLNAFATGRDPQHAAIALTTGIIGKLERPELEGVIAHEMGHIINRDIRTTMLISTGVGVLTLIGNILIRVRGGRGKSGRGTLILNIVGVVLLIYGAFLAPVIMYALSRQREYQADATSAYLTRNPLALASALEKISGRSELEAASKNAFLSAVCIANANGKGFSISSLFATHPPIEKRVAVLKGIKQN